jgi:SEC-C motif
MEATVGRNEPCPCGSGKKFKRCHGDWAPGVELGVARESVARRMLRALDGERRGALRESIELFTEELDEIQEHRLAPFFASEVTQTAISTYAMYDLVGSDGLTFADRFRATYAATLSADDLAHIDRLNRSFADFYEVRRVDRGAGLDLRNLRNGRDVFVHERAATETLVEYDIIVARVVEVEPGRFELFPPVMPFGQMAARDALADLKRMARDLGDGSSASIRDVLKAALPGLHARWVVVNLSPSLSDMVTSEGEALAPTTVTFRIADRPRAIRAIEASDAFEREGNDAAAYAFLGPEGTGQLGTGQLLLGKLHVGDELLRVEVMAVSRIERVKGALAAADAGAFEFLGAQTDTLAEAFAAYEASRPGPSRDDDPALTPELAALRAEFEERWHRAWIDQEIPALSGRTPREAARSRTLRPRLVALIKEMQADATRRREDGQPGCDFGWMWKELGLQP